MSVRPKGVSVVLACVLLVVMGSCVYAAGERVMLLDFETEEDLAFLSGGSSQQGAVTFERVYAPDLAVSGEYVLKVNFQASEARGWAVLNFKFPMQNWGEDYAISLWHKGDGRAPTKPGHFGLRLGLHDRYLGGYWAKEPDFRIDNTDTEWKRVECKMAEFFKWRGSFYDFEYILWDWATPSALVLGVGDGEWFEFSFYIDCVELIKN